MRKNILPAAVVVSIRSDKLTRSAPLLASCSLMTITTRSAKDIYVDFPFTLS